MVLVLAFMLTVKFAMARVTRLQGGMQRSFLGTIVEIHFLIPRLVSWRQCQRYPSPKP